MREARSFCSSPFFPVSLRLLPQCFRQSSTLKSNQGIYDVSRLQLRGDAGIVIAGPVATRRRPARRPGPGFQLQLPAREPGPHGRARQPQRVRAAHAEPDRRARISEHVRHRGGIPPAVRARPCAAASDGRRLARSGLAQLCERGSEAHPSVQALPRGVQARLPGRLPGDRSVRSDRRRKSFATIRSRWPSSS